MPGKQDSYAWEEGHICLGNMICVHGKQDMCAWEAKYVCQGNMICVPRKQDKFPKET